MSLILLIEDEMHSRQTLRHVFEEAGHTVAEAASGREGLTAASGLLPDLILLDVMLPEMNGWDVCRQLKANPLTRTIPVLILTGNQRESDELRGWESGIDDYMTKPWSVDPLLAMISRFLAPAKAA